MCTAARWAASWTSQRCLVLRSAHELQASAICTRTGWLGEPQQTSSAHPASCGRCGLDGARSLRAARWFQAERLLLLQVRCWASSTSDAKHRGSGARSHEDALMAAREAAAKDQTIAEARAGAAAALAEVCAVHGGRM